MRDARVVIIGGGVIGLSAAYHLARLGIGDVLLVERNQLGSGTSWHAAGIVGPLRTSASATRLTHYALELLPRLAAQTGQDVGFRRTGGLWLARRGERMAELARVAALGDLVGIGAEIIDRDEIARRAPDLRVDDLSGALWVEDDAQASPVDLCMAYARGARSAGARILEGVACTGFERRGGVVAAVHLSSGERVRCETVLNCAGAWARRVAALADVPVPLQAVEHMYVVTEPIAGLSPRFPVVRDLDGGVYLKADTGRLLLGGFEYNAKVWDPEGPDGEQAFVEFPRDWDQFEPFMKAGLERVPALASAGIRHFMNGPEAFTPDSRPLIGESPFLRGFYVAAGFNSTGMMSSAGVGRAVAEWIRDRRAPFDLWEVDVARFDRASGSRAFLGARMKEAVGDVFGMHWPYKQARAGRGLRRSALHRAFAEAGAVFGAPTGWERPMWFARSATEAGLEYSFGAQPWWPSAEREAIAVRDATALLELTPFTKIDVCGADALALLQRLCANQIDVEPGRAVYTQMLNAQGGIEADLTVTRRGEIEFRVVSGAATRYRDLAWINAERERLGSRVGVFDATSAEVVLGVMGPHSRALLESLSGADLDDAAFPFATTRRIEIGGAEVYATRMSFVGELGWELYIAVEFAAAVYEALLEAGARFALDHCGLLALDSCRMEKGYRHWGHDIGPGVTPLEAGLGFAVAWDKAGGFTGRDELVRQRERGVTRRLLQFAVDGGHPLLLHEEPIRRDGRAVGRTTSGARGFRTGLSLCMGYVPCAAGTPRGEMLDACYEVDAGGERFALRALAHPPYDAAGARMRGCTGESR